MQITSHKRAFPTIQVRVFIQNILSPIEIACIAVLRSLRRLETIARVTGLVRWRGLAMSSYGVP